MELSVPKPFTRLLVGGETSVGIRPGVGTVCLPCLAESECRTAWHGTLELLFHKGTAVRGRGVRAQR